MPPAPPDSLVGRAGGPVGAARRIRTPRRLEQRTSAFVDSSKSSALEALLVDLGSQVHRGASQEAADALRFCPTGLETLDSRLGGGFPIGRLSEICGAPSSGRTSLALALLSETLRRGVLAAWIDLADAFDPISAALTQSDLDRLLWVRARSTDEVLRSSERLLQTEGFELVIVDLATHLQDKPAARRNASAKPIRDANWLRLARLAASARSALVVISNASTTGSRAELVLEMKPLAARFVGPPDLLEALETNAVLERHRSRPTGQEIPLLIQAEETSSDLETNPDTNPKTDSRPASEPGFEPRLSSNRIERR